MTFDLLDYFNLRKYNITNDDLVRVTLNCERHCIRPNVIITPIWRESIFKNNADNIKVISENLVYDITYRGNDITFVRSGIGAAQTGDIVLSLGVTACKNLVFIGSAGALKEDMNIGDFVIPTVSIAGDNFSRFLTSLNIENNSICGVKPNSEISKKINDSIENLNNDEVGVFHGPVFSTDSMISQFLQMDAVIEKFNCICVEMETASVFTASKLVGIKSGALLQISDVVPQNKTLFSGRTKSEIVHKNKIKESLLVRAAIESFDS